jgi:hypothetical protein
LVVDNEYMHLSDSSVPPAQGLWVNDEAQNGGVFVPWPEVRRIVLTGTKFAARLLEVQVTKASGDVITGTLSMSSIEGIWQGMRVKAHDWVSVSNFQRADYVEPPTYISSYCSFPDYDRDCMHHLEVDNEPFGRQWGWGVWRFYAQNGESLTGLMLGGFGIDRSNTSAVDGSGSRVPVGLFPSDVLSPEGAVDYDGKLSIAVTPGGNMRGFDFSMLRQSTIKAEMVNREVRDLRLDQGEGGDIVNNGFLVSSTFGNYQVGCVVRVRNLRKMELEPSADASAYGESYARTRALTPSWSIATVTGQRMQATAVQGRQSEMVPEEPPQGKYWRVRPPVERGEAGGDYVVSPNDEGYCLIPLAIISEFIPGERSVRLRDDAGGIKLKFARFHPGNTWISSGESGISYIDEDADTDLPLADMWLSYASGGQIHVIKLADLQALTQQ